MPLSSVRARNALAAGAVTLALVGGAGYTAFSYACPTPAFAAENSSSELIVDDNYPALNGWISNKLGNATAIKISTTTCGISDGGSISGKAKARPTTASSDTQAATKR